jgi:chromosome segregation ATPase
MPTEHEISIQSLNLKIGTMCQDVVEIKSDIKALTAAMTKLAIVEERQTTTNQALDRAFSSISSLEHRISALERQAPITQKVNAWVEKVLFAVLGGAVIAILSKLGVNIGGG